MLTDLRPKISVFIATSIDGYIAGKNDDLSFLDSVQSTGEDCGYSEFFSSIDTLVMGRKTYEWVVNSGHAWPYSGKRVIVLSRTLNTVPMTYAELAQGDIVALTHKLYQEGTRHIYVDGGVTLCQFLNAKLVDEITLSIIPIILGSGTPLFAELQSSFPCTLMASKSYKNGIVQMTYALSD